jgi:hypothetical protein
MTEQQCRNAIPKPFFISFAQMFGTPSAMGSQRRTWENRVIDILDALMLAKTMENHGHNYL